MSRHEGGIDAPERRQEYRDGMAARQENRGSEACPYGFARMLKRSLFLAGWHDMDIALGAPGHG